MLTSKEQSASAASPLHPIDNRNLVAKHLFERFCAFASPIGEAYFRHAVGQERRDHRTGRAASAKYAGGSGGRRPAWAATLEVLDETDAVCVGSMQPAIVEVNRVDRLEARSKFVFDYYVLIHGFLVGHRNIAADDAFG